MGEGVIHDLSAKAWFRRGPSRLSERVCVPAFAGKTEENK